jgi:hypothetical protein
LRAHSLTPAGVTAALGRRLRWRYASTLAALLVSAMTPAIAHAGVLWKGDAEQAPSLQWAESSANGAACGVVPPNMNTVAIQRVGSPYPVAQGKYSYRFEVSNGDDCWGSRAELGENNPTSPSMLNREFYPGQDRWISFQAYFPDNYQMGDQLGESSGLLQIKQNGAYGPPALGIGNGYGDICMFIDSLWYQHYDPHCGDGYYALGQPAFDTWIRLTLHVFFSTTNQGFVEVWGNLGDGKGYRLLLSRIYAPTMKTDPTTGQPIPSGARIGIYRSDAITGTEDLYVDGFTVSTDEASANANAFAPPAVTTGRAATPVTTTVSLDAGTVNLRRRTWIRARGRIRANARRAIASSASTALGQGQGRRHRVVVSARRDGRWRAVGRGWTAGDGSFSLLLPLHGSLARGALIRAEIAGVGGSNSVRVR